MLKYNASILYDKFLYKEDILGSIAFARANAKSGIISNDEFAEIERGLREVQKEWEADAFIIMPNDEDIHIANERRLGEIIGKDIAGKLHTGRSRNEQVVCDMRMWLRDQIREIESQLVAFIEVIAARAEAEVGILMPGYTHLQRAMVVMWSQHLLSFGFNFVSDLERLRELLKRVNRSPLGSGALAGNGFNIDRDMMAEELGFEGLLWNSMNAVADRDFVTEFLQWGSMFMQHISRWPEDLILYSSTEFSFISIADAYSTGSSLMPQKKNPDGLGPMMTQKGLSSTYNKDLQESWEPMLDHVKTISDSVQIANGILSTLTIRPDRMRAALDPFMLATDLADYLVRKGVPFRETHHISGRCVAKSEELGVPMNELSLEQLQAIDGRFMEDVLDTFNYETSVEMRSAKGGTSRARVLEQVKVLKAMLA
ncbi:L-Aspartase-like protein [Xylaria digitata]|nr:L-Aspartase-like protein [Xylaria digitata]